MVLVLFHQLRSVRVGTKVSITEAQNLSIINERLHGLLEINNIAMNKVQMHYILFQKNFRFRPNLLCPPAHLCYPLIFLQYYIICIHYLWDSLEKIMKTVQHLEHLNVLIVEAIWILMIYCWMLFCLPLEHISLTERPQHCRWHSKTLVFA